MKVGDFDLGPYDLLAAALGARGVTTATTDPGYGFDPAAILGYTDASRLPPMHGTPRRTTPMEVQLPWPVDVAVLPLRFELERIRVRPWMQLDPDMPARRYDEWVVEVHCRVLDVNAGLPIAVAFEYSEHVPSLWVLPGPERSRLIARLVRSALLKMMEHEVSECVMANGQPLVVAHPNERPRG